MLTQTALRPSTTARLIAVPLLLLFFLTATLPFAAIPPTVTTARWSEAEMLPLAFIPNRGQFAPGVALQAQGRNSVLQFMQNEVILRLPETPAVHVQWEHANPAPDILAGEAMEGVANYMRGDDPTAWQTDVPMVAGLTYAGLYDGIDLTYDGHEGTLKGTYTVAPGADPARIRWHFQGASDPTVDRATGDLRVTLPDGTSITEQAPIAWQVINGVRQPVAVAYQIEGDSIGFALPDGYDTAHALIIDPTLIYSTYLGGSGTDKAKGIAYDAAGNLYIVGETSSSDLLGYNTTPAGYTDIFITKLNPAGSSILYMSVIGSNDSDYALAIDTDAQGNAVVTGSTYAANFPTLNALFPTPPEYWNDSILFKLNGTGNLVYSTYLPLNVFDAKDNLAVDGGGNAYVVGTLRGVEDPAGNYLMDQIGLYKVSSNGSSVLMEKHMGATDFTSDVGVAVSLDNDGDIYIAGIQNSGSANVPFGTSNAHQPICGDITHGGTYCYQETTIFVLNPAGTITYASYHGGSFTDTPAAIASDGQGNILLAGNTASGEFPLVNALQTTCPPDSNNQDCNTSRGYVSVIHLDPTRATLTYSTYWGAPESDSNNVIHGGVMDSSGNVYITGYTNGRQFPLKDALQSQLNPSFCTTLGSERYCFDAFVTKFTPTGQLGFSTYFGATFDEFPYAITLDPTGNIVFAGLTEASDFQTTSNAIQRTNSIGDDGFLVKIGMGTTPPPTVTPGGPTVTPSPTGQPVPPTVTATPNPNLKKTFLPLVFAR